MTRASQLREHVRAHAENRPGIYRMLGPSGELLYVGKSIRVRSRLLSYFRAERGEKAAEIIGHAHAVEWEYTPSEFAALLAELRTIRHVRPPYNVEHKREKFFCFVKLTREAAPRLLVVRRVVRDGSLYFGPFRGPQRVREMVREVSDLLELRDCAAPMRIRFADQFDLFSHDDPPRCMRGDLERCLAPCAGRCTEAEYHARVLLARRFLEGDADRPIAILAERMHRASERLQFEYAATLRDRASRLEAARDEVVALRGAVDALSLVYPVQGHAGENRWYVLRRGVVRADLPAPRTPAQRRRAAAQARAILQAPERDGECAQPQRVAETLLVARWFRSRPEELKRAVPITALPNGTAVQPLAGHISPSNSSSASRVFG